MSDSRQTLSEGLVVEDHGDEFYLISSGQGHDITIALERDVAQRLADFILNRRGASALGGKENKP